MRIVYRYRDGVFECPYYARKGERLSLKQYDDEWGCRIGKAFMLGDSPAEAIENTLTYLGDEPVNADDVQEETPAAPLSPEERVATESRVESLYQSLMTWKGSKAGARDIERKLKAEQRKLR